MQNPPFEKYKAKNTSKYIKITYQTILLLWDNFLVSNLKTNSNSTVKISKNNIKSSVLRL